MALGVLVPDTGGHRHSGHWQGGTAVRRHVGVVHGLGGAVTRWDAVVGYAVTVARLCNGSTTRWCTGALVGCHSGAAARWGLVMTVQRDERAPARWYTGTVGLRHGETKAR
jgi:hypothetical protein